MPISLKEALSSTTTPENVTDVTLVQVANALSLILVTPLPNVIVLRFVQFWNALFSILPAFIVRLVSDVQPLNASYPMSVTVFGHATAVRVVLLVNAQSPMVVISPSKEITP